MVNRLYRGFNIFHPSYRDPFGFLAYKSTWTANGLVCEYKSLKATKEAIDKKIENKLVQS